MNFCELSTYNFKIFQIVKITATKLVTDLLFLTSKIVAITLAKIKSRISWYSPSCFITLNMLAIFLSTGFTDLSASTPIIFTIKWGFLPF